LLEHTNTTRREIADRLGWKPSRVTKVLSGEDNRTLRSVVRFVTALGYDFDVVLRRAGDKRAGQMWERPQLSVVLRATESFRRRRDSHTPSCQALSYRYKPMVRNADVCANDSNVKSHEAVAA
jgi:transcriptional regulator with XRE-family HTH domain